MDKDKDGFSVSQWRKDKQQSREIDRERLKFGEISKGKLKAENELRGGRKISSHRIISIGGKSLAK